MAKATAKTTTKTPAKAVAPKKAKATATPSFDIGEASEAALMKLKELGIEQQLQSDLEWCIGSYSHDKNPSGLYAMAGRALQVLTEEKNKKTKGVTVKLIGDLEKALKVQ